MTLIDIVILRWKLGEMTLESLTTLRVLIHWYRGLHTTIGESSAIHILLPENVIKLILLILHLSMSINIFLWLLWEVASSNSKTALSTRWCVNFHWCVTFRGSGIGTLWILLLLLSKLIPLLSSSIASSSRTETGIHSSPIEILLGWHLFTKLRRIHFLLLGHKAIHRSLWFLLFELLLIFVDLILVLHLVVLLLWGKGAKLACAIIYSVLWSRRFEWNWVLIAPSQWKLWISAYFYYL